MSAQSTISKSHFGLIETLLFEDGQYPFLKDHLDRLQNSCAILGFPFPTESLKSTLNKIKKYLNNATQYKIRLILYHDQTTLISYQPICPLPDKRHIFFSPHPTFASAYHLQHKTTLRQFYDSPFNQLQHIEGFTDILFHNYQGHITEGSRHNLIIKKGKRYITPPLSDGVLPGTARKRYIAKHPISEQSLTIDDIKNADKLFLSNAIRGLFEVTLHPSQF